MCAYLPIMYFHWWNVCSNILPIFILGCFFITEFWEFFIYSAYVLYQIICKYFLQIFKYQDFLLCSFPEALDFTFRSVIYLELIFADGARNGSKFICFACISNCSKTAFKREFLLHWTAFALSKLVINTLCGSIFRCSVLLHWSTCLPQCHHYSLHYYHLKSDLQPCSFFKAVLAVLAP